MMHSQHKDPVTGDTLTTGEYISWLIQSVIRRWVFLIAITIITALAWLTANSVVLQWWNLSASYLAIMIESIVGIALFAQTKRDAVVMRETRAIASRDEEMITHLEEHDKAMLSILTKLNSQEELIVKLLERTAKPLKVGQPRLVLEDEADTIISQMFSGQLQQEDSRITRKPFYFPERDADGGYEDFDSKQESV